jgi:hypothetical protein
MALKYLSPHRGRVGSAGRDSAGREPCSVGRMSLETALDSVDRGHLPSGAAARWRGAAGALSSQLVLAVRCGAPPPDSAIEVSIAVATAGPAPGGTQHRGRLPG